MKGWALVTGASSGLGVEFARQLAKKGHDVVLVARRAARLEELAKELRVLGIRAEVAPADLGTQSGVAKLVADLDARGLEPSVLINNAGFGAHGVATEIPIERSLEMVQLNMSSVTELALIYGKRMAARGEGAILNVGSTASFQPTPYFAVYAATKAYVLSFSMALARDLAPRGVRVIAHCPGGTRTEFFQAGGVHISANSWFFQNADQCVREGLLALDAGRSVVVTGILNKIMSLCARLAPLWLVTRVAQFAMRPTTQPAAGRPGR